MGGRGREGRHDSGDGRQVGRGWGIGGLGCASLSRSLSVSLSFSTHVFRAHGVLEVGLGWEAGRAGRGLMGAHGLVCAADDDDGERAREKRGGCGGAAWPRPGRSALAAHSRSLCCDPPCAHTQSPRPSLFTRTHALSHTTLHHDASRRQQGGKAGEWKEKAQGGERRSRDGSEWKRERSGPGACSEAAGRGGCPCLVPPAQGRA